MAKVLRWALFILIITANPAIANLTINMPIGVTEVSHKVYQLHMITLGICVAIGILVFGVMIYAIIFHRRSVGYKAANFHASTKIEVIWTIIPLLILIGLAVPATKTIYEMDNVDDSELTVKITGYMWRWHYEYVGTNVSYMSDLATSYEQINNRAQKDENYLREVNNPLVLPINKKIRLLMTANDVIHSWWVPDLGVKKDAIPGFINETWTRINVVGTYRGQCAELCGERHAYMPIVVRAVPVFEFIQWMQQQQNNAG